VSLLRAWTLVCSAEERRRETWPALHFCRYSRGTHLSLSDLPASVLSVAAGLDPLVANAPRWDRPILQPESNMAVFKTHEKNTYMAVFKFGVILPCLLERLTFLQGIQF
jgi:hypothetical protein